ncbi:hypothetical protein LEP1GSC051_2705, partial [Leptospira sp. P2653]
MNILKSLMLSTLFLCFASCENVNKQKENEITRNNFEDLFLL